MAGIRKSEKIPKQMQATFDAIVALTDKFSRERLNEEYVQLARQVTAALARKRPSPLLKGSVSTWACGIVYALGSVNFIFDKSQELYMNAADLCEGFGVSKSTGAARAKVVRDTLNMTLMDPNWCLPSKLEDHPLAWMIQVNGLIVDARSMPREIQEEAYRKGLIPYLPDAAEDALPPPPRIQDRRLMERQLRAVGKLVQERESSSIEEINAFLQEAISKGEMKWTPETPLEKAQELVYQALEAPGRSQRIRLARQALELSPDCADAYVVLGDEARTPQEARDFYVQGVAAGARALGPDAFEEYEGVFWGAVETRPYMRAKDGLAQCLWFLGEHEASVGHLQELLRLNPDDHQGVRYILAHCLLELERDGELSELLERYKDDASAAWQYTRALVAFRREGASRRAGRLLGAAFKANLYVPEFLLGKRKLPRHLPAYMGLGDANEATNYMAAFGESWAKTAGALEWLARQWE